MGKGELEPLALPTTLPVYLFCVLKNGTLLIVIVTFEYSIRFSHLKMSRIFVDGANPSFIRALKERLDEDPNYEKQIDYLKSAYPSVYDLKFLQQSMYVIPIPFSKYHKDMLAHCKEFLEYRSGLTAIHPRHEKLITALRTAVENGEGILDKGATSHSDCFDAFRMSMQFWH